MIQTFTASVCPNISKEKQDRDDRGLVLLGLVLTLDEDTHPAPVPEAFYLLHLKLVRLQNRVTMI